jgi:hypothetical protein
MMKYAMLLFAVLLTTFDVVDTVQGSQAANNSEESLVACRRSKDIPPGEQADTERSGA